MFPFAVLGGAVVVLAEIHMGTTRDVLVSTAAILAALATIWQFALRPLAGWLAGIHEMLEKITADYMGEGNPCSLHRHVEQLVLSTAAIEVETRSQGQATAAMAAEVAAFGARLEVLEAAATEQGVVGHRTEATIDAREVIIEHDAAEAHAEKETGT